MSGLIDFYFACTDFLAYDVAICLNAWCFEADFSFNVTKGRAMLRGYEAIRPLLKNLNERAFQKLPGCRASAFAQLDAPALQPLPVQPYELARFKTVIAQIHTGQTLTDVRAIMRHNAERRTVDGTNE